MANLDLMDRLLATARLRLPGVIESALCLELFNAVDEFFRETNAWRHLETIPVTAGYDQFPIFPPAGSALVRAISATHNGAGIPPTSFEGGTIYQRGNILGQAGPPDYDALFEPDVISSPGGVFSYSVYFPEVIAINIPASDDAARFPIELELALTLNVDNIQYPPGEWPMPEYMFATHFDAFLAGVLAKMMQQLAKPYSNPQLAAYNERLFRKLKSRAKQEIARGFTYNKPNWRFPMVGGSR